MRDIIEVTSETFEEEVLNSNKKVLVDFWASWCPPCKMMEPVINRLENNIDKDKVKIVKINIDRNSSVSDKYSVKGVPTFIVFKNGDPFENRLVGAQTLNKLKKLIENQK